MNAALWIISALLGSLGISMVIGLSIKRGME